MDTTQEWFATKYEGYYINKQGQIKKKMKTKEQIYNGFIGKNGYLYVSLGRTIGKKTIHSIMGDVFIPNPHNLRVIDHINRIKTDNRLENLRWFSQQDNMLNRNDIENIFFCNIKNMWCAKAGQLCIGYFDTEAEAKACKYGYLRAKDITIEYNHNI